MIVYLQMIIFMITSYIEEIWLLLKQKEEDMYSRVKRVRKQVKRNMYGVPVDESETENTEEEEGDDDDDDDEEGKGN